MSTQVNLTGRFTKDPELRFSQKGTPVATFTVVTAERYKDGSEWKERNTTFSLEKGAAVIVCGRAYQEKWQAKDGTNRYSLKVTADDVAPTMRWDRVTMKKPERDKPSERQPKANDDPWSAEPASGSFADEPPF